MYHAPSAVGQTTASGRRRVTVLDCEEPSATPWPASRGQSLRSNRHRKPRRRFGPVRLSNSSRPRDEPMRVAGAPVVPGVGPERAELDAAGDGLPRAVADAVAVAVDDE